MLTPLPLATIILILIVPSSAFTFLYPSVTPSTTTITTLTTYQFTAMRNFDPLLATTPYNSQLVPAGSNITVIFPQQYNLATHIPVLDSLMIDFVPSTGTAVTIVGNNFTITGAVPSALGIANVVVTVSNVMNPSPALTTDPFLIAISNDISSTSTAAAITLTPAAFQACSLAFSPSTVNTTSQLQLKLSPTNALTDNGYVVVVFPSSLQWSQDISTNHPLPLNSASCTVLSGNIASGSCTGSTTTTTITYTLATITGGSINSSFSIGVNGLFSPPTTTPSDTLTITSYSSNNYQIDTCTSTISGLTAHQLTLTIGSGSSPLYINTATSLILTFTLLDTISKNDYFVLALPTGTSFNFLAIATTNLTIISTGVTYYANNYTLVMKQAVTSPTRYTGTLCTITLSLYTSPPSTLPSAPFTLSLYDSTNGLKMTGQNTLTAVAKTYSATVTPLSAFINAVTSYTLVLTTQDKILADGRIILTFPSDLSLSIGNSCVTASNVTNMATIQCSLSSQTVTISNLSTATVAAGTYSFTITQVTNANSALTTSPFALTAYYTNNLNAKVGTSSIPGTTLQPKPITNISTALSDYQVGSSGVTLNVTFTNVDALPTQGSITVVIPSQFGFVTNYLPQCLLQVGTTSSAVACTRASSTFTLPLLDTSLPASAVVTLSFISFAINPTTTKATSPLQLSTHTNNNNLVDNSNTTAIVSGFLPASFLTAAVSIADGTNSASSNYSVTVQQLSAWGNGSTLTITLPPTVGAGSSVVCYNASSGATITCTTNTSTPQSVIITLEANNVANINIVTLLNAASLRPTSTYTLTTLSNEGYAYCTSHSITTANTLPSPFLNASYSFSSHTYNSSSTLTLTITHTSSSDQLTLSQFQQFTSTPSCSEITIAITCALQGTTLVISPVSSSTTFPTSTTLLIQGLTIPAALVQPMTLQSFQGGYLVSQYSPVQWSSGCTIPCLTCQTATPSVCLSCFQDTTLTTSIYFYNSSCLSSCPAGTYTQNTTCVTCTAPCAECSSASVCLQCLQQSSSPILNTSTSTCVSSCAQGFYPGSSSTTQYTPICLQCISPCATCSNATTCLTCSNPALYFYLGQCLATCPLLTTIANATAKVCDPCSSTCLTCVNTTTTCLTCNVAVAPFLVQATGECLTACVSPLVAENNYCVSCLQPCASCQVVKTNCTVCLDGYFLSSTVPNSCVTTCEQYSFPNSTSNTCQLCSTLPIFCTNCYNETYCLSCDPPHVLMLTTHSCVATVPAGYVNISGIATACSTSCLTCSATTTNCTTCPSPLSLYSYLAAGQCIATCPIGTVSISYVCSTCTFPCHTCDTLQNNCTSCITGYLLEFKCLDNCPAGTFINASAVSCDQCSFPCGTCEGTSTYCLTCSQGFLYGSQCLNQCPSGTAMVGSTCLACVSPCLWCSFLTTNCTSCVSSYYFYAATNRCYSECPSPISVNDTTSTYLSCIPCSSPCLYCQTNATQCTACSTGSLYHSQCLTSCPTGYYDQGGLCQTCTNNCLTCTITSTTCSSCLAPYALYSSSCVSVCPVSHSIVVSNACTACANSCLNCTSSNYCYECPANLALYLGACVSECPSPLILYYNTSSSVLNCFTQTQIDTQINSQTLAESLQLTKVLPLPFTIVCSFFFLCCLMSKIQYIETYVVGIAYSLYGCAQSAAILYVLILFQKEQAAEGYTTLNLLLWITLALIMTLNAAGLMVITPSLCSDQEFINWLAHKPRGTPPPESSEKTASFEYETNASAEEQNTCCTHQCTFISISLLSLLLNYKLRLLLFTKLFRFSSLTAHLEDIQGFRVFNVMSYLSIFYEGLYSYVAIRLLGLYSYNSNPNLWFAAIDAFVLVIISFLLALIASQKDEDFFKVRQETRGVDLGRRKIKKDKQNFKIDPRRTLGLNSRDKLIDINESISSIDEEQDVYVNHNIESKVMPKRVTSEWVQVEHHHPPKRQNPPASSRSPPPRNIFDLEQREEEEEEEEEEDDSEFPFSSRHRGELSIADRIELYHTSVRPKPKTTQSRIDIDQGEGGKKSKVPPVESRVAIDLGENNKVQSSEGGKKDMEIQSHFQIDHHGGNTLEDYSQPMEKPSIKLTESEVLQSNARPAQKSAVPSNAAVIKEIQSQNFNSSVLKSLPKESNIFDKKSTEKDVTADDLNKTVEEGIIEVHLKQKSYDSVLPFIHEDGVLRDKIKQEPQPEQRIVYPRQVDKDGKDKGKNSAVVANSYLLQPVKGDEKVLEPLEEGENILGPLEEDEKRGLQNFLQLSQIKEGMKNQPPQQRVVQPTQQRVVENKPKSKIGFAPIQLNTMISPSYTHKPPLEKDLKQSRESSVKTRPKNLMVTATRELDQKIQPKYQLKQPPNVKAGVPITHAPKVFSRIKLAERIVETDQLEQFELKLTKRAEQLNQIRAELLKNNQRGQQQMGGSRKRSKKSIVSDPSLFTKHKQHQLIILPNKPQDQKDRSQEPQQVEEVELSERGKESARNIFDQPVYTESQIDGLVVQKKQPTQNSLEDIEILQRQSSQVHIVGSNRQQSSSEHKSSEAQQIEVSKAQANDNKEKLSASSQQSKNIHYEESRRSESKTYQQQYADKVEDLGKAQNHKYIEHSKEPEQEYEQFQEEEEEKQDKIAVEQFHPTKDNLPKHFYVSIENKAITEVSEPKSIREKQEEEDPKENQLFQIQNQSQHDYLEEGPSEKSLSKEKSISKKETKPVPVGPQRQQQQKPKFVAEEEDANLSWEESKSATVHNKLYTYQQDSNDISHVNDSFGITNRTKKKMKIPSPPPSQAAPPYQSPFIFNKNQQTGPLEMAPDYDEGIHGKTRASGVKPVKESKVEEQPKEIKVDHQEVIQLLNKAQRNSRSRNKLPKEEKDERIAIKMSREDLKRGPHQKEETSLVRKSLEKNKPIGTFTLKKQEDNYEEETPEQPQRSSRQGSLLKNYTALQLQSKVQRPSRLLQPKPASSFALYSKNGQIPQLVNYPKRQQQNEVRQFNFGDEISSQVSHLNSEAEMLKWKEHFLPDSSSSNIQPPYYQPNHSPAPPHISKVTELDEYYEEQEAQQNLRRASSKGRHKSKKKKGQSKSRNSHLQKIYGI